MGYTTLSVRITQWVQALTVFLWSDAVATILIAAGFSAATIRGRHVFLWKAHAQTSMTAG